MGALIVFVIVLLLLTVLSRIERGPQTPVSGAQPRPKPKPNGPNVRAWVTIVALVAACLWTTLWVLEPPERTPPPMAMKGQVARDSVYNLGSSTAQWKNIYIDGAIFVKGKPLNTETMKSWGQMFDAQGRRKR